MPSNASLVAACARPTRLLPLVLILAALYYFFFAGSSADHSHATIYPEQPPSQQYLAQHNTHDHPKPKYYSPKQHNSGTAADCPLLQGIENVYVVLKTGASQAQQNLPIHFSTTLKCIDDYIIYSDFEETVSGRPVYDALDEVNRLITGDNREFDLYRRLKKDGKTAIGDADRGRERDSQGWKLDKWKFLPMMEKVWRDRPTTPWFVFMEDDTYVSWTNLLHYLSKLNSHEPHYIGAQMQIDQVVFAHGGSGFVMSNEAMRRAVMRRRGNVEYYDGYTASHWAGDCVLGQLMDDANIPVHWAWANFQGQAPATLGGNAAGYEGNMWCDAAITFHHVSPDEIESLWRFERQAEKNPGRDPLTHVGVLKELVLPEILALAPLKDDWDNQSDGTTTELSLLTTAPEVKDPVGHCKLLCERDPACVQFRVSEGRCQLGNTVMLGYAQKPQAQKMQSGWLVDRVKASVEKLGECADGKRLWVLPERGLAP